MESQDIQAKFPEITGHSRNLKELVTVIVCANFCRKLKKLVAVIVSVNF